MKAGILFGALLATALLGCSGDETPAAPPQVWHDITISIETSPSPPQSGMTEILVMATEMSEHHPPAHDLLINLRTADSDEWTQAIEDGYTGVYRRAVLLAPGERSTLQMQVKRGDVTDVLRFPLKVQP